MIERGPSKLRVHYFRHKEIKNLLCLINSHFIRRWELKGSVFQFQHTMKCARVPRKHCCKKIHTWPTVITLLPWEYSWIQHTYWGYNNVNVQPLEIRLIKILLQCTTTSMCSV